MMKVYVCGGSSERALIASYIKPLREAGVEITHDWTACEGYARTSTLSERVTWANQDLEGVRKADLVWAICPDKMSEGCFAEIGAALALRKTVFVSGPFALRESRIFALLARHFPDNSGAFREICAMANEK